MKKTVIVIGKGGREHALAWKLQQSPHVGEVICVPGNAGTAEVATNILLDPFDFHAIAALAREKDVALIVPGPDRLFAAGIVDFMQQRKIRCFGPTQRAARLESSKLYANRIMEHRDIPHARTLDVIRGAADAQTFMTTRSHDLRRFPVVLKADELMDGKGVYVVPGRTALAAALHKLYPAGDPACVNRAVSVDSFLTGFEVSAHVLTDGRTYRTFPYSHDYKKALDDDRGDNTGGMGCVAPIGVPHGFYHAVCKRIVEPLLVAEPAFRGLLYPGLMLSARAVNVIEFNVRFGDPETQAYMLLLESDLFELLMACVTDSLAALPLLQWRAGYAVCIAIACDGYPGPSATDRRIMHIAEARRLQNVQIFQAGTINRGRSVRATGGRALYVVGYDASLEGAIAAAYRGAYTLDQRGLFFRHDIGADVRARLGRTQ